REGYMFRGLCDYFVTLGSGALHRARMLRRVASSGSAPKCSTPEWVSRLTWAFGEEKRLTRPRRPSWPSARPARAASLTARAPGVTVLLRRSLRRDWVRPLARGGG